MARSWARKNLDNFRDPKFFGGLCSCCRKRKRHYIHPDYPHLCNECLRTRVRVNSAYWGGSKEPMVVRTTYGTQIAASIGAVNAQKSIQSLNASTTSQSPVKPITDVQRVAIAENAAQFREHIARNPITDEQRKRIAASAEAFRRSLKK